MAQPKHYSAGQWVWVSYQPFSEYRVQHMNIQKKALVIENKGHCYRESAPGDILLLRIEGDDREREMHVKWIDPFRTAVLQRRTPDNTE